MIDGIDGSNDTWECNPIFNNETREWNPVFRERLEWAVRLISDQSDPADYRSERNFPGGHAEIHADYWREKQTQFYEKKKDCIVRGIVEMGMAFGAGMAGDLAGAYEHAAEAGSAIAESIISDFAHAWDSIAAFSDSEKDRFK